MSKSLHVLLIAPYAPPKNAAEAIQVRRILAELDKHVTGRLVTIIPTTNFWMQEDKTLALALNNFSTQNLALPLHRWTSRILGSRYIAPLLKPDSMCWIMWLYRRVLRNLEQKPDIIYSRSSPMSAAVLALTLKQKLRVPWIMHLSDPWADNPYTTPQSYQEVCEAKCFQHADRVLLTTQGQADFYKKKYPAFAHKISVSPNVMPPQEAPAPVIGNDARLHIVFAGNLYGNRSPQQLINAVRIINDTRPDILEKLHIDIYGKAEKDSLNALRSAPPTIQYHGMVAFDQAYAAQQIADVILSIEPEIIHPLGACFLPSKVLESLALGKPLLAMTPRGSETDAICREGYGWSVAPADAQALATQLIALVEMLPQLRSQSPKTPPVRYQAAHCVEALLQHMHRLAARKVLMEGYYGRGNFGDDILLKVTHGIIRHAMPDARIAVVIGDEQTDYVQRMLGDVDVQQPERHAHFEMIVHGGGGVFFDFKRYGIGYRFIEIIARTIGFPVCLKIERIARALLRKPRVTADCRLGLGIGVSTFSYGSPRLLRNLAVFAGFDALWLRDAQSTTCLERFKSIMHAKILQGSDLAFLTQYWVSTTPSRAPSVRPRLGIILRDWPNTDYTALSAKIASLAAQYEITGFIFDAKADTKLRQILAPYTTHVWQPATDSIEIFASYIATQDVLLASRAHGAICGACLGVPSVIVNIEPKLEQVHAMLPNTSILVSAECDDSWEIAVKKATTIASESIRRDVAKNTAASEAALAQLKGWWA